MNKTIDAVGKLGCAWETVERLRGHLYDVHQLMGTADITMREAADALRAAGHEQQAKLLEDQVLGRDFLEGKWTYQVLEEFEKVYYNPVRAIEQQIRDELVDGKRHLKEAAMKRQRRTE